MSISFCCWFLWFRVSTLFISSLSSTSLEQNWFSCSLDYCDPSTSSLGFLYKGWSDFEIPSKFTVIFLVLLCPLGLLGWPYFLRLALVRVLRCSNIWSPISSGAGVTLDFCRYCRGNQVWKLGAYKNLYLLGIFEDAHQSYFLVYPVAWCIFHIVW